MTRLKGPANETPSVTEVFATRLRGARNARDWTQQDLSDAMTDVGVQMDRTTIAKLEKGTRSARVEELVALAAALDVSPLYLFLPLRLDTTVKLAPNVEVEAVAALQWASGEGPLDRANERTYRFQAPTVPWVTWTAGKPGGVSYGGGLSQDDAENVAFEVEATDRKKGGRRAS